MTAEHIAVHTMIITARLPCVHKFVEWRIKNQEFKGSSKMAKERRSKQ